MAIRKIVKYPEAILKQQTTKVSSFDKSLAKLLDDMQETMFAANGLGLAAPQVGVGLRAAIICGSKDNQTPLEIINPIIVSSEGSLSSEEGCLSIPDYREKIPRAENIHLKAQDRSGKEFEIQADGLLAICAQHEIDHLDGILIIDRISRLKFDLFQRWYKKHGAFDDAD
jgi:peptide deformylase